MSKLFEDSEINGLKLTNRFVRSATWEAMATESGASTPKLSDLMADLAKGGVGLIVSGHSYVSQAGKAGNNQLSVCKNELISGLREMTTAAHDNGAKIIMQLAHAGIVAASELTEITPLAPSRLDGFFESDHQEMSATDIQEMVAAFASGAKRAQTAGFDGVQIHAAHGYLLSQFLSPHFNRRQDEYGGSIQNRARALLEVVRSVRSAVGNGYPVLVKMNCQDFHDNGLSLEDAIRVAILLAEEGLDAIEISGGNRISGKLGPARAAIKSPDREAYFQKEAAAFKKEIDIPLILVGGIRSFQIAERLVDDGVTDYISMCRPLIREPDLINRWKSGDRRRASCVSDNLCFGPARSGAGIYCVTEERQQAKKDA